MDTNARTAARTLLEDMGDEELMATIDRAEEAGATWIWDPQFTGVAGLMNGEQALLVAYIEDEDFEYDYMAVTELLGR